MGFVDDMVLVREKPLDTLMLVLQKLFRDHVIYVRGEAGVYARRIRLLLAEQRNIGLR